RVQGGPPTFRLGTMHRGGLGCHMMRWAAMAEQALVIERLALPVGDSDLSGLARLLVDAVESGAAVTFIAPLALEQAEEWWRRTIFESDPRAVYLVARDAEGIVGTVQLHPARA